MNEKELKVLQASLDNLHVKLTTVYGVLLTANIPAGLESEEIKTDLWKSWSDSYQKAKDDAFFGR